MTRFLILAAIAGAAVPAMAAPALVYRDQQIYPLAVVTVTLTAGRTYTLSTGLTPYGGDPVVHVWGPRYVVYGTPTGHAELAHDDDSAGGVNARVTFTAAVTGSHTIFVRAATQQTWGSTTLYLDGAVLRSQLAFGGTPLAVRSSTSATYYEYEAAPVPGGGDDTLLYALDCAGKLLGWDDFGGVGGMGRIANRANVCTIVMDSRAPTRASLFTNDVANDMDGDGLGSALEAALFTCDNTVDPACTSVVNPRDTDRDGLEDSAEVFGLDTNPPQYLSMWGADPRHKDLFLELDWWAGSGGHTAQPVTEPFIDSLQALYDVGSKDDLLNPDGKPGVHLHVDIGRTPSNPADTRFGNWGGSDGVTATVPDDWQQAINREMVAARQGVFRYGYLENRDCLGSGNWRHFHVGVLAGETDASCVAHELGHTVGLGHGGHASWGQVNCKPNYKSLMNYSNPSKVFSLGLEGPTLNPTAVSELAGIGGNASFLGAEPWNLGVSQYGFVDFNRSDLIETGTVRAAVTLANSECNALDQNYTKLRDEGVGPGLPDMVRWMDRLYVFYADTAGVLHYRSGQVTGADASGSCPLGDAQKTEGGCMTFNAEQTIPTARRATSVSAIYGSGGLLVAFRTTSGEVATIRATAMLANGDLGSWTGETVVVSYSDGEPELAWLPVDPATNSGATKLVGLFYTYLGQYRWVAGTNTNQVLAGRGAVVRGDGTVMPGSIGASIASWPHIDPQTACGAFVDASRTIAMYCWDKTQNRFVETASGADFQRGAVKTYGKPGLAFHQVRSSTGGNIGDGTLGQFWLSYTAKDYFAGTISPFVYISSAVSSAHPPLDGFVFEHTSHVATHWAVSPNTSAAFFEDYSLSALKGARLHVYDKSDGTQATRIDFLPFADGTFDATLIDGNDFQVMERAICLNLRGDTYCGPTNIHGY